MKCLVIALSGSCVYGRAMELLTNGHHSCLQCCILARCFICSRVRVRNKYKIKGSSGSDYLLSLCCSSSVLLQLVAAAEKVSKAEIRCLGSLALFKKIINTNNFGSYSNACYCYMFVSNFCPDVGYYDKRTLCIRHPYLSACFLRNLPSRYLIRDTRAKSKSSICVHSENIPSSRPVCRRNAVTSSECRCI